MMRTSPLPAITVGTLVDAVGGVWVQGTASAQTYWLNARIDSRLIEKGEIFIALPGTKSDGHSFLEEARRRGALLAIVGRKVENSLLPQLIVADPMLALREMGRLALLAHRESGHRLVALTGSVGKTTTKELIKLALSSAGRIHATKANENNEIGVPLTLLSWPCDASYCVLEVGVRKASDIDYLAPLLRSDVGIVTAIGPGHLEHLRTIEEVWREKSKLLRCVVPGGTRIVPEPVRTMFPEDPIFSGGEADMLVVATLQDIGETPEKNVDARIDPTPSGFILRVFREKGKGDLCLSLSRPSVALAWCSLLALLVVRSLGEDIVAASRSLSDYDGLSGRMERRRHSSGLLLLLDHYNANPASMKEALSWLAREMSMRPGSRGFAILGDMLELGGESGRYHEIMGEQTAALSLETLWYKGEQRPSFEAGFRRGGGDTGRIRTADTFESDLISGQGPSGGDVLLVKGSRGMKLEDVVAPLIGKG